MASHRLVVKPGSVLALALAGKSVQAKRTKASYAEFHEQVAFAQRCDLHPEVKHLLYSASMQGVNLSVRVATQAKAKGVKKGVPDWMLYAPSNRTIGKAVPYFVGLALEFKSPTGKGKRSPEQERWAEGLRMLGWRVEFPRTAEEAWGYLVNYLGLRG